MGMAPPMAWLGRARVTKCLGKARYQISGIEVQGSGELQEVEQGDVHLASLDMPDVGAVQPGRLAEVLLAHFKLQTSPTNSIPEFGLFASHPGASP